MKLRTITVVLLITVALTALLVSCGDGVADVTTRDKTHTDKPALTTQAGGGAASTTAQAVVTTAPLSTTAPISTEPLKPYEDTPIASEDGKVTFDISHTACGPLFLAGESNPLLSTGLLTSDELDKLTNEQIEAIGLIRIYGNKTNANYKVKSSKIFISVDAFTALEAMMASFKRETGKGDVQIVSAYEYVDAASLKTDAATGFAIKMNVYDTETYPLNYSGNKVTVGGESMTYLEWFKRNSHKFGYVFTGLSGEENNSLANFRYVGTAHSYMLKDADSFEKAVEYVAGIKSGATTEITDAQGTKWTVMYKQIGQNEVVRAELGENAKYFVSGVGSGEFVVVYTNTPKS